MMEPLAAIQRLAEARAAGLDSTNSASAILQSSLNSLCAAEEGSLMMGRTTLFPDQSHLQEDDGEEDYEDEDPMNALCSLSAHATESSSERQQVREPANAVLFNYRGERVAGFEMDAGSRHMICLPQVYELFLKQLVGGLHTVYTKLKRLHICPLICNVEQVRALRSLGAIQPGVNRCKLIEKMDFDKLYDDCTNTGSRPGRPPKRLRSPTMDDCWSLSTGSGGKRDRVKIDSESVGQSVTVTSKKDLCSASQNSLTASNALNIFQQQQQEPMMNNQLFGNLLPLTAQHLIMQHMMAAAAAVVSQQQLQEAQEQKRLQNELSHKKRLNGEETFSGSNNNSTINTAQNGNLKARDWTNNNNNTYYGNSNDGKEFKCQREERNRFSNQFCLTTVVNNDEEEEYSQNGSSITTREDTQSKETGNGSTALNLISSSKFNTTTIAADFEGDSDSTQQQLSIANCQQTFLSTNQKPQKKGLIERDENSEGDKNSSSGNQSETDNDSFEREKSLSAALLNDRGDSESSNRSGSQNRELENSPSERDQSMQFAGNSEISDSNNTTNSATKITEAARIIEAADIAFKAHYDKLEALTTKLRDELSLLKASELEIKRQNKMEKQKSDLYFRRYSYLRHESSSIRKRDTINNTKKEK